MGQGNEVADRMHPLAAAATELHPNMACGSVAARAPLPPITLRGPIHTCRRDSGTSLPYRTSSLRPPGLALVPAAAAIGCRALCRRRLQVGQMRGCCGW